MNRTTILIGALLLTGLPMLATSTAQGDAEATGGHLLVHARLEQGGDDPTAILAVEAATGSVVLIASVEGDGLHVSDGTGEDGEPREYLPIDDLTVGTSWHRYDILLHGDTYTLHIDQRREITARTFVHADEGRWIDDPLPLSPTSNHGQATWAGHRVDNSAMAYDATFTDDLGGWEPVVQNICLGIGCGFIETRAGLGYHGVGEAEIFGGTVPAGVTYLRAPTAGMGGTYSLHTNLAAISTLAVPRHEVFAGLSGPPDAPTLHWAIDAQPVDPGFQWALFFEDGQGEPVQVSPDWADNWHEVTVDVDEPNGRITIVTDGGEPITLEADLGSSTHVGVGYVRSLDEPPRTNARFDNLALYEEAST